MENKNLNKIKVIAFDFWGVFAEMNPPMYRYMEQHNIFPEKYSEKIHELIIEHDLNKINEQQFLQKCSKIIGLEIPYPACRYAFQENDLNKNLITIAKKLKAKYKIALLSNNNKEYCEEYLFKTKLEKLFDVLVLSYNIGYRKPSPEIYQILIKKLEVKPEEILFIDDNPTKFPNAEKQGIKTLLYEGVKTDLFLRKLE
ncbi:MAG: HAD family phosphatase [Minisyncoccia bacterium]